MFGQQASWDVGICALPVHGDERTATNGSREVYSTGDSGVVRVQPVRVQPAVVIDQRMYHTLNESASGDRPANVPLDERKGPHHEVEWEGHAEAPIQLAVEAKRGDPVADGLVDVRVIGLPKASGARQRNVRKASGARQRYVRGAPVWRP